MTKKTNKELAEENDVKKAEQAHDSLLQGFRTKEAEAISASQAVDQLKLECLRLERQLAGALGIIKCLDEKKQHVPLYDKNHPNNHQNVEYYTPGSRSTKIWPNA